MLLILIKLQSSHFTFEGYGCVGLSNVNIKNVPSFYTFINCKIIIRMFWILCTSFRKFKPNLLEPANRVFPILVLDLAELDELD